MPARIPNRVLSIRLATALTLSTAALAGCSSDDADGRKSRDQAQEIVPTGILPPAHVHGVEVDPADPGVVLLATHDGLFRVDDGVSTRVGPVIDLMGFTVAESGRYLASGHPGPGVDLPQPIGLIESTDGGRTWEQLSRQGESDFHALAVSAAGVLGYDGSLLRSSDGREWEQLTIPAVPASLAVSPDGGQMLAATAEGLLESVDGGASWSPSEGAPLLQVVDWGSDAATVVGVGPTGGVWTSSDAGGTWVEGPRVGAAPQAIGASGSGDAARIVVVTATGLLESTDGGRSFAVVLDRRGRRPRSVRAAERLSSGGFASAAGLCARLGSGRASRRCCVAWTSWGRWRDAAWVARPTGDGEGVTEPLADVGSRRPVRTGRDRARLGAAAARPGRPSPS